MNPRTTGILLLLAAVLGVFVYLVEIRGGEKRREAEQAAKRLFSGVEEAQIRSLVLETSDEKTARLERIDGSWRLREPVDFPGDPVAVDGIASSLAQLESKTVLEDPQPPQVYGLGDDARTIGFQVGETGYELRIGEKTPVGSETYVSTAQDPRIFTVESFKVTGMSRSLDDLRERRPLHFDREGIQRIEASWPDGAVVLEKRDDAWQLLEPLEAPADETTLDTFLSDLSFLRASGFLDQPPPDEEVGLDRPAFRVVLTGTPPDGEGEPVRFELSVGDVALDDGSRAARAVEPSLYKLTESRLEVFPRRVAAYRHKELSRFVGSDAQRLELVFRDVQAAEGGRSEVVSIVAERGEEGWTSTPEALAAGRAARMISELSRLRAEDIAAESMSAEELAEAGLAPPNAVFRVFGAASEESDPGEELAEVRLGEIDGESGILAQARNRFVSQEEAEE
jgi:hypothetical protein